MSTQIIIAIIASLTSLFISLITYFQTNLREKRQSEEFDRIQKRATTTKLLDLRLDSYPKAFEITEKIRKTHGGNLNPIVIKSVCDELNAWRSGIVRLIISSESQWCLFELRAALSKNPEKLNEYSTEQVDKIWNLRNDLRKSLRKDIGILHEEDENRIFKSVEK